MYDTQYIHGEGTLADLLRILICLVITILPIVVDTAIEIPVQLCAQRDSKALAELLLDE